MLALALAIPMASSRPGKNGGSCVSWRQTGGCDADGQREEGGDRGCRDTIESGNSGYCECSTRGDGDFAGYVGCDHEPFTCEETCSRSNLLGYMEDTVWYWNDWRDVEFRSGGKFFAPDADNCHDGTTCTWSVKDQGRKIAINWGTAGEHTVELSPDRKKMKGSRFDGDPCHGTFKRRDKRAGRERHKKRREELGQDEDDGTKLYDILELDSVDATESQIKKQFRRLSRKYHPDKNRNNPDAAEKFEQIREAYEVIGNPDKRTLYDTGGLDAVREAEKEDASQGSRAMDPFAAFFGGGGGGEQRQAKKGNDANVEIEVSLEDLYNGNPVSFSIQRRVVCRGCKNGGKGKNRERCSKCGRCPNEVRTVMRQMAPGFNVQQQEEVPSKHRCREEKTELEAVVERGMKHGSQIRFERMSEQRPGFIPGDVIMTLKQKPHKMFRREGNDLHMDMVISLKEALLGFSRTITHLDGHEVVVSSNGRVTKPWQIIRLKGEGMPHHETPDDKGVLHVKMKIQFPRELSDEQRAFVEQHF